MFQVVSVFSDINISQEKRLRYDEKFYDLFFL